MRGRPWCSRPLFQSLLAVEIVQPLARLTQKREGSLGGCNDVGRTTEYKLRARSQWNNVGIELGLRRRPDECLIGCALPRRIALTAHHPPSQPPRPSAPLTHAP